LNNSSEKTSEFLVVENLEGFVENVINYPNPFAGSTQFAFDHDLNDSNIDITVDIYAMSGVLIKSINAQRFSSDNRIDDIEWDATDFTGGKISKGIYIYKIKVVSDELNLERESDFKKLVLLN
jgi:flagellar hook assembly protein FlgD